jgi:hypothetical protein
MSEQQLTISVPEAGRRYFGLPAQSAYAAAMRRHPDNQDRAAPARPRAGAGGHARPRYHQAGGVTVNPTINRPAAGRKMPAARSCRQGESKHAKYNPTYCRRQ